MKANISDEAQGPSRVSIRKDSHLDVVLNEAVSGGPSCRGLGHYVLEYDCLPELNLQDVDLSVQVLGKRLQAPILIGAMTGGSERAALINRRLARAAEALGLGMALGSQRAMLEDPALTASFAVREAAPDLPLLIGNVGAVQLNYGLKVKDIERALAAVNADALALHLNPLQEAVQPQGDTRFGGLQEKIRRVCEQLSIPTLIKEVGAGISPKTAAKLADLPLSGIEVAGQGGTSWARVESYRAPEGSPQADVGQRLAAFGVPTDRSLIACRAAMPQTLLIASGGLRTGMDIAVSIALGADCAAMAQPLLQAAVESEEAVIALLQSLIYELRVIAFCTGARNIAELKQVKVERV